MLHRCAGYLQVVPSLIVAAILLLAGLPAGIVPAAAETRFPVRQVTDQGSLVSDRGDIVLPAGLGLPPPDSPWRDAALDELRDLAGEGVVLGTSSGTSPVDRYGRTLAPVTTPAGDDIAGLVIAGGLGWVLPDGVADPDMLYRLERDARRRRLGIWSDGTVPILHASRARSAVGRPAIIWGEVRRATDTREGVFLDFGDDWRRDFSVLIPKNRLRTFREAAMNPDELVGRSVEVRGYAQSRSGVLIVILHPEALRPALTAEDPSERAE